MELIFTAFSLHATTNDFTIPGYRGRWLSCSNFCSIREHNLENSVLLSLERSSATPHGSSHNPFCTGYSEIGNNIQLSIARRSKLDDSSKDLGARGLLASAPNVRLREIDCEIYLKRSWKLCALRMVPSVQCRIRLSLGFLLQNKSGTLTTVSPVASTPLIISRSRASNSRTGSSCVDIDGASVRGV